MYRLGRWMVLMYMFDGTYRNCQLLRPFASHRSATDLHENVSHVEDTQTRRILRIVEIQIILETSQTRSSNVVAIEVVHDVDQHEQTAPRVQLALQGFLDRRPMGRIHGLMPILILEILGRRGGVAFEIGGALLLGLESDVVEFVDLVCHFGSERDGDRLSDRWYDPGEERSLGKNGGGTPAYRHLHVMGQKGPIHPLLATPYRETSFFIAYPWQKDWRISYQKEGPRQISPWRIGHDGETVDIRCEPFSGYIDQD